MFYFIDDSIQKNQVLIQPLYLVNNLPFNFMKSAESFNKLNFYFSNEANNPLYEIYTKSRTVKVLLLSKHSNSTNIDLQIFLDESKITSDTLNPQQVRDYIDTLPKIDIVFKDEALNMSRDRYLKDINVFYQFIEYEELMKTKLTTEPPITSPFPTTTSTSTSPAPTMPPPYTSPSP